MGELRQIAIYGKGGIGKSPPHRILQQDLQKQEKR